MKVLVIRPNEEPKVEEIDGSLESMQELVGGYIETVCLHWGLVLVCNEEGKLIEGLKPSLRLANDYIYGTCFMCQSEGENLVSISDEMVKALQL